MRKLVLALSVAAGFSSAAQATPIEQIYCISNELTSEQKALIAEIADQGVASDKNGSIAKAVGEQGAACYKNLNWNDIDLENAMKYTTISAALETTKTGFSDEIFSRIQNYYLTNQDKMLDLLEGDPALFKASIAAAGISDDEDEIIKIGTFLAMIWFGETTKADFVAGKSSK